MPFIVTPVSLGIFGQGICLVLPHQHLVRGYSTVPPSPETLMNRSKSSQPATCMLRCKHRQPQAGEEGLIRDQEQLPQGLALALVQLSTLRQGAKSVRLKLSDSGPELVAMVSSIPGLRIKTWGTQASRRVEMWTRPSLLLPLSAGSLWKDGGHCLNSHLSNLFIGYHRVGGRGGPVFPCKKPGGPKCLRFRWYAD